MERLDRYPALKARGLISWERQGDRVTFQRRRFDPDTGLEVGPEASELSMKWLREKRRNLMQEVEAIDALLTDIAGGE